LSLVRYFAPPIPLSSEKNITKSLRQVLEWHSWNTKAEFTLPFGAIDLVAWNDKNILLYEVKHNACFNELVQALGQILVYREQIKEDGRKIRALIHTRSPKISKEQHDFLERVFAKHNVEFDASFCEGELE